MNDQEMRGSCPGGFPIAGTAEWCLALEWWLAVVGGGMYVPGWEGTLCSTLWEHPGSEFFLFFPSVSLLFQRTVNPGILGSEEKAPSGSSHATRGLPWIMEHALMIMNP